MDSGYTHGHYVAGCYGSTKEEAALKALVGRDWQRKARLAEVEFQDRIYREHIADCVSFYRQKRISALLLLIGGRRLSRKFSPFRGQCGFDNDDFLPLLWLRFVAVVAIILKRGNIAIGEAHEVGYFGATYSGYSTEVYVIEVDPKRFRVDVFSDGEMLY